LANFEINFFLFRTMNKILSVLSAMCLTVFGFAQQTTPSSGEVKNEKNPVYYFKNATIWIDYQTKQENASLLIKNGLIEGINVAAPKEAIVMDLQGKHIYPSFIDLYSDYGMPEVKQAGFSPYPQYETNKKGAYYWNQAMQAEVKASELFKTDDKKADEYRKLGFGAVLTHQHDGVIRGTGALVSLHNEKEHQVILKSQASGHFSLRNGSSRQEFPSSVMGRVALIRQTYLDADWYSKYKGTDKEVNLSLESFNQWQNLPQIFEANGRLNILRADKIGDEFGKQYIFKGSGDEYQRLEEIKATKGSLIIPLNFPEPYDVEDPLDAVMVSLAEMKHWELAPYNAKMLAEAGINFAFTTADLKSRTAFLTALRQTTDAGLDKKVALKALTFTPAQLLGVENQIGSLKKGMIANFIITSKDIFEKDAIIHENWIQGNRYLLADWSISDIRGVYKLQVGVQNYELLIEGDATNPSYSIKTATDTNKIVAKVQRNKDLISISFNPEKAKPANQIRLSGWIKEKSLQGEGQLADGTPVKWQATFSANAPEKKAPEAKKEEKKDEIGKVIYPFVAHGMEQKAKPETILIKNATVWTNEQDGILKNTDVLLKDAKISKIGKNLSENGAKIIDGTGKHLTAGIIDEHSHIALSAVNESSQSVTAEVRMYDAVNSEDINIYRNLAGGVVAAQLLHGSANSIGGQSALVKLKWGEAPDAMRIAWADGFIKFALGENVKQSNWGDNYTVRFPQTRMGVEQVMIDAFTRAREYEKAMQEANKDKKNPKPFRRDLELEALVEILNKKRFITCHSYVQSEINMLMKVADKFGFKVNTFTHILEGYKVADKMAQHGAAGSTFADWWGYKNEVKEAIPFNAALMSRVGVVVAINSDDAEMSRRLNHEAAKAVKYGAISEEEAWKMVTLNPAKMLHLDSRMGSIKVGKDADVVLWSENPLSVYAKAEKTIIEGAIYFDIEKDMQAREYIKKERARITQKMIGAKASGVATQKPQPKKQHIWHCEDRDEEE
jgi:imidazolonepropionase-like amidohydrolase